MLSHLQLSNIQKYIDILQLKGGHQKETSSLPQNLPYEKRFESMSTYKLSHSQQVQVSINIISKISPDKSTIPDRQPKKDPSRHSNAEQARNAT